MSSRYIGFNISGMNLNWERPSSEMNSGEKDLGSLSLSKKTTKQFAMIRYFNCCISIFYSFQYDYHSYCHRKHTLSSLIELIDLEDKLFSQEMYLKAAAYMINSLVLFNDIKHTIVSPIPFTIYIHFNISNLTNGKSNSKKSRRSNIKIKEEKRQKNS